MPLNTSVTIGDHFTGFVGDQVRTGRYGSTSEVVRAGLRLLEQHEAQVKALQQALEEGERSGQPQPIDFEAFKKRKRAELPKP